MGKLASYFVLLGLIGYLVLVKLALTYGNFPVELFAHPSQKETFEWYFIGILAVAGLAGVWLAQQTGFPEMLEPGISNRQRFLLPLVVGMSFGLLEILADRLTGMTKLFMELMHLRIFHVGFPASALVYPGGAIIVEILYRLLPLPLIMGVCYGTAWLVRRSRGSVQTVTNQRSKDLTFWVAASILSWFEPVTQSGVLGLILPGREFRFRGHEDMVMYEMLSGYSFNLLQAYFFRRFGFLACLSMRVGMYLVWHVLWGYLTQSAPA
jgi:hypothetical protein